MTAAPLAMATLALRADGIRIVLGGTEVLRSVDVSADSGRVLGILGPSGAGKTTLFRVLSGEIVPPAGSIKLAGIDVTRMPLWKRARLGLGYVPQAPSVLLDLTVRENVRTFERVAGVKPMPPEERAAKFQLGGLLGVRARDLSGGERRRLELLRALMAEPRVLICDEPFAAGDPAHVRLLAAALRAHADRGGAVVLADHRVADALAICDDAVLIVDGSVLFRGPAAEFADHPAVRRRYLGAV